MGEAPMTGCRPFPFVILMALAMAMPAPASAIGADHPSTGAPAVPDGAESPLPLDEMVVVAAKTARPLYRVAGQVTVLDRDRLDRELVQDFSDIARYEPALEVDFGGARFGNSGLSIRGIGENRVAFEIDGVPLPQQFNVGNFADSSRLTIDPAIIQRIEILRGPASALYGSDALGGVVIVTTVDAADRVQPGRSYSATGGGGFFGANDATLATATGAFQGERNGFVLSLTHRQGDEIDNEARSAPSDLVDFDQYQLFAKWTHNFAHGGDLRATVDYFHRETDSDLRAVLGFERFANTSQILGDDRQRQSRITVEYRAPALTWLDEGTALIYRTADDNEQRTRERRTSRGTPLALTRDFFIREQGTGGEVKGRRDFTTGPVAHVLVGGFEWDRAELRERRAGTETNLVTGTVSPAILGERFPLRDFPLTRTLETGLYLQDEIAIGRLTLIPALRWDRYDLASRPDALLTAPENLTSIERNELTFRFGLTYKLAAPLTWYAHYAEGFRAPPAEDVNLLLDIPAFNIRAIPNPDLEPETSQNLETGFRLRHQGLSLDGAFYYSDFDDFIESRVNLGPDPQTGVLLFQSRNLAKATIYGFEADARQDLGAWYRPLAGWQISAGVHYARGEDDTTERPLNSINPLNAVFAVGWQPAGLPVEATFHVRYLGRQDRTDFSSGEFFVPPSATVLDLTAQWSPWPWMQWNLGLFNLADKRYWRFADTRNFTTGDPRADVLSRPGRHLDLTLRLSY